MRAGENVPVRPRARTVVGMALAVDVDPAEALEAAGFPNADITSLIRDVEVDLARHQEEPRTTVEAGAGVRLHLTAAEQAKLTAEIERIQRLPYSADVRLQMLEALLSLWEAKAAESGPAAEAAG